MTDNLLTIASQCEKSVSRSYWKVCKSDGGNMADEKEVQAKPATTLVSPDQKLKKRKRRKKGRFKRARVTGSRTTQLAFPKHALSDCLRIPKAILEQNAGKECSDREAAAFAGIGYTGAIGFRKR
jgi:hypothetical protein